MAVPVPKTWVAAEFVDAAEANLEWRDAFNFLFAPPRAFAYRGTDFSTTTSVDTVVAMSAELYDPYSPQAHDNTTNPSRMIGAEAGIYQVVCSATWDGASGSGRRQLQVRRNAAGSAAGGTQLAIQTAMAVASGFATRVNIVVDAALAATDYVEMFALQSSGGNLNVIGSQSDTFMSIRWVAKQ